MSLKVFEVEKNIIETINRAILKAQENGALCEGEITPFNIEIPNDRSHGDYATNAAMVNARVFKRSPRDIATAICDNLETDGTYIKSFEIAGPGFINLTLSDRYYSDILVDVKEKGEDYGKSDFGEGKSVLVEFVSANPTGPMHIGNARGGALGDCLAAVLGAAGYDAKREFYVNDAGNQIEKFKTSLETRYLQLFDETIEMPEDAYLGEDIINHAKAFKEIHGDKFVNAQSEERRTALCDFALPKNIQGLEDDLAKYRIIYDRWYRESELHNSGAVAEVIDRLKQSGYTYEQAGALWFKSTEFGDEKDRVLIRDNGIPTYFVPDIAYHYDKLVNRKFDVAIDVLGADHHGYIARMKAAMEALGVDPQRLQILIMQMVRLVKNGETYKLSKRSGKAITLSTLLDEMPIDAARFFFNLREPNSHLEVDLDLAISESSQNPVYYVQYAHARICSILRNLKAQKIESPDNITAENLDCLTSSEERELIRHIASYTGEIITSAKEYNPSVITRYAITLATLFHKFYNACPVKSAQEDLRNARIELCVATKTVIKNVLDLLKIDAPEQM
ncbi:MAG: arginine--tRNA ligase [Clostridia bacterium]|nr:arginine--tRNA ligase [Clostridia bacterium]